MIYFVCQDIKMKKSLINTKTKNLKELEEIVGGGDGEVKMVPFNINFSY